MLLLLLPLDKTPHPPTSEICQNLVLTIGLSDNKSCSFLHPYLLLPNYFFSVRHISILLESCVGPSLLPKSNIKRQRRWQGFKITIRGIFVRIWSGAWDLYQYGVQVWVSSKILLPLLIQILILLLLSLVANPVNIETEARLSRISTTITMYQRLGWTNHIALDPPPPNHLFNQTNLILSTPLIP